MPDSIEYIDLTPNFDAIRAYTAEMFNQRMTILQQEHQGMGTVNITACAGVINALALDAELIQRPEHVKAHQDRMTQFRDLMTRYAELDREG